MQLLVRTSLVALLVGAVAAPLVAQDIRPLSTGPERTGFWWGFGVGGGSAKLDCTGCGDSDNGGAGWSSIGPVSMLPSSRTGPCAVNNKPPPLTAHEKGCASAGSPQSITSFIKQAQRRRRAPARSQTPLAS